MKDALLLLYAGPDGDRWSLRRGGEATDVCVLYEPAPASGLPARIDIGRFLAEGAGAPQQALLRLLGALVERNAAAAPAGGPVPEAGASAAEPTPGEAPHGSR